MIKNVNTLIFIMNIMTLTLLIFFYFFIDYSFTDTLIIYVLFTVFILTFIFSLRREKHLILKRNYFKHSTLVVLGLLIVGFQKYLDYCLGYIDKSDLLLQVSQQTVAKSSLISLIGLTSFFIGFLLKTNINYKDNERNGFEVTSTKLLSILAAIFLLAFILTVNPLYVFGGYGIYDMGLTAIYYSILFKASIFALVIQKVINISQYESKPQSFWIFLKSIGYFNVLMLFIYCFIVLLSGDRGDMIAISLLVLIGYTNASGEKISRFKSIVLITLAAFIITMLGIARSFNTLDDSSFVDNITKALAGESNKEASVSVLPFTAELSDSVKAIHYSVEYVPSQYEYVYSRFHMQSIFGAIPLSSSVTQYIFSDNSVKYTSSANYVTWLIAGDNATSGQGTSIFADFYLSYGLLGVVLGMAFFGWLIRYSEQSIEFNQNKYLIMIIISIVMFTSSIFLSRSSLFASVRLIVWIWTILVINRWISHKLSR